PLCVVSIRSGHRCPLLRDVAVRGDGGGRLSSAARRGLGDQYRMTMSERMAGPTGSTGATSSTSTALLTDRYELTMVQAALADGTASRECVFEVFTRRLPPGRRYG